MVARNEPDNVLVENARFIFQTNFEGRKGKFNKEGDRNFNVVIPDEQAKAMAADGWNIKWTKPNEERPDEFPQEAYLPVDVRFDYKPAHIVLLQDGVRTNINEITAKMLDEEEFERIDLTIRPYLWSQDDGSSGVKAYLKTMYAIVPSDPVVAMYANYGNE